MSNRVEFLLVTSSGWKIWKKGKLVYIVRPFCRYYICTMEVLCLLHSMNLWKECQTPQICLCCILVWGVWGWVPWVWIFCSRQYIAAPQSKTTLHCISCIPNCLYSISCLSKPCCLNLSWQQWNWLNLSPTRACSSTHTKIKVCKTLYASQKFQNPRMTLSQRMKTKIQHWKL